MTRERKREREREREGGSQGDVHVWSDSERAREPERKTYYYIFSNSEDQTNRWIERQTKHSQVITQH